ncbi:P2R1A-PPP2R2A-interacting phosphatase regulator 1-like [Echinops telfairi]|uniref:P2R1A-PPP2R2A-interacting phosphatase regulator 1-like n=1 Tax=Echinops telfairi TaxID=9371 RepID=A0AC55CXT7_ECHTE|nr:P2R1A-PPP2R2A-interacting phosphatase regulator 1-like [Echinops telfairi]
MAQEKMDPRLLSSSTIADSNIRRSSRVPWINGFSDHSQVFPAGVLRTKQKVTQSFSHHCLLLPPSPSRTSISRLHQIKQDECMDFLNQEVTYEREVHAALQINRCWEEKLILNDNSGETPSTSNHADVILPTNSFFSLKEVLEGKMVPEDQPKRVFQDPTNMPSSNTAHLPYEKME